MEVLAECLLEHVQQRFNFQEHDMIVLLKPDLMSFISSFCRVLVKQTGHDLFWGFFFPNSCSYFVFINKIHDYSLRVCVRRRLLNPVVCQRWKNIRLPTFHGASTAKLSDSDSHQNCLQINNCSRLRHLRKEIILC